MFIFNETFMRAEAQYRQERVRSQMSRSRVARWRRPGRGPAATARPVAVRPALTRRPALG